VNKTNLFVLESIDCEKIIIVNLYFQIKVIVISCFQSKVIIVIIKSKMQL